jgi:hypothetical protein
MSGPKAVDVAGSAAFTAEQARRAVFVKPYLAFKEGGLFPVNAEDVKKIYLKGLRVRLLPRGRGFAAPAAYKGGGSGFDFVP